MNGVELLQGRCVRSPWVSLYNGQKHHTVALFVAFLSVFLPGISYAAPPVGTSIPNQAQAAFTMGAISSSVSSNTAVTVVSGGPTIGYYANNSYGSQASTAYIGTPLFVQANADACNLNSAVIDTLPITIASTIAGDTEVLTATETSPDSGLFRIQPNIQTRNSPRTLSNGILEVAQGSTITVQFSGCGAATTSALLSIVLIDPNGIVFDSETNQPIGGAVIELINAATNGPATVFLIDGVTPAPSIVTTGPDGFFSFPLVPQGTYFYKVTPPGSAFAPFPSTKTIGQLPSSRTIHPSGSFGGTFQVNVSTGPVKLDIPLDPRNSALFVEKTSSRKIVEIAEFLDYTVRISNNSGVALPDVTAMDNLPAGFAYEPGTLRLNGAPFIDPDGGRGPQLRFGIGALADATTTTLTYRVRVGPGSLQGDGTNRVQAFGGGLSSNIASTKVTVQAGVFSEKGIIIGKIYMDCNRNRIQDQEELGIPGVRIYLEDGTYAISDSEGKYTFYGIRPQTHVLKIDKTTLPPGAELITQSNRNAGDAGSRFVDLKKGELHPADFAIGNCDEKIYANVNARRAKGEASLAQMEQTAIPLRPGQPGQAPVPATPPMLSSMFPDTQRGAQFDPVAPGKSVTTLNQPVDRTDGTLNQQNSQLPKAPNAAGPIVDIEMALPQTDATLGFLDLKEGDTLPMAQTSIRVKGFAGSPFSLTVNGKEIPESRVGTKAILAEKQLEAWEYIGVNLAPGPNTLEVRQNDNFGIARKKEITVIAPDELGVIKIGLPMKPVPADGQTPAIIGVRLEDKQGVLVTTRTFLTLDATVGTWQVEDLNKKEPGIQVAVEGGEAEFLLVPPGEPADTIIRVTSGLFVGEEKLAFVPNLRPLILVGVLEGTLDLRKLNPKSLMPTRNNDGFEEELRNSADFGATNGAGRAALFLKGKISGDALLTMGFDSDKNTQDRIFRDIQPEEFYPVYGDASVKGFDAQSTGRLYIRVDKNKSFLLYGDYTTLSSNEARQLGQYSRSLNGLKGHYENSRVNVNAFASHDTQHQMIEELPAQGISGPYQISRVKGLVENSEKVEILVRDRNQPSVILKTTPQMRFSDYALEPLTGRLLFKAPIPSRDQNLNPISIRVTYELRENGEKFWVAGADAQVKITDNFEVGGSYVKDMNPQDSYELKGGNVTAKLTDKTFLFGEIAQSDKQSVGSGMGKRIELRHNDQDLQLRAYYGETDKTFENQMSFLGKGRREAAFKGSYRIDQQIRLLGEVIHSEDLVTNGKRDGSMAAAEYTFENNLKLEAAVRRFKESGAPSQTSSIGGTPTEATTLRGKVTVPMPYIPQLSLTGEYEQSVTSGNRRVAGVGMEYQMASQGRLYMRHEFLNSLGGQYALNGAQRQNATVFGMDTSYMKDGKVFSEYRVRDAMTGRETQAAFGLRNKWSLTEGVTANTSLERIQDLGGTGHTTGTAVTGALEYFRDPSWKGTARLEKRFNSQSDSLLGQVGLGYKLTRDWTLLGKNTYAMNETGSARKTVEHFRLGVAYRETDTNVWNGLGRYEFKHEDDPGGAANVGLGGTPSALSSTRNIHILATDWTYHPGRPWTFMGGYAFKWVQEDSLGIRSTYHAQLVKGRVTYDITERWDVGFAASNLFSGSFTSNQYALGLEVGHVLMANVWVSVGYNVLGFKDRDLSPENYENQGFYLRLRMKFDEDIFEALR